MLFLFTAATVVVEAGAPTTYSGYVVDQMCAKGMAKKANPMEKAAGHTKSCALEENCASSGYGIFSDGKYYPFDEKGSETAKSLIEKSKRTKGMYFEVTGELADGKLTVTSMKEATPKEMTPEKKMEKMEMKSEKKY